MKLPIKSADFEENIKKGKTCLLMYSGGVDTSICVHLLQKYYGYKVITFTVDVCQDQAYSKQMAKKAKKLGAVDAIIYKGRDEFADKYLSQVIKSNAFYDDYYPVGTSIARPWQAKLGIDLVKKLKVDAIAHGNKGRGAGAFQFNMVMNFFMPGNLKLVTPIGDWWPSRDEEVDFALKNHIPIPVETDNPFSYDDNIASNAINYGDIDDVAKEVPESAFKWTKPIDKAPGKPEWIELAYENGLPVKLNGKTEKLSEIFIKLNILGGQHGVGRINMLENGLYGNKFKWVYEAPAAQILIYAHKELEKLVLPKETLIFKHEVVDKRWTRLVYQAQVFSPLASALMAFTEKVQKYVSGKIVLKLYKGNITVASRNSGSSLVNIEAKNLKLALPLDEVPYGFEEYSFALRHPEVFAIHLGKADYENFKKY